MAAIDCLVLVGLPGAGKSTVGALVASELRWEFVDLDREIEREAGKSVAELFRDEGEAAFREREHRATAALSGRRNLVVAPGGGWMVDPRNRALLGARAATLWLAVTPAVAAARLASDPTPRPLLQGSEPEIRLRELLARREASYLQSNHTVTVDLMSPAEVASLIVALATGVKGD